jgi:hypothetical protein
LARSFCFIFMSICLVNLMSCLFPIFSSFYTFENVLSFSKVYTKYKDYSLPRRGGANSITLYFAFLSP